MSRNPFSYDSLLESCKFDTTTFSFLPRDENPIKDNMLFGKRKPIKHSEVSFYCKEFLQLNKKRMHPSKILFPNDFHRALRNEIKQFIRKYEIWLILAKKSKVDVVDNFQYLLTNCLTEGFNFNKAYKKMRDQQTLEFLERGENRIITYPSKHLIFFEDESPKEDHEFALRARPTINQRLLSKVKSRMYQNMRMDQIIREFDILDEFYLLNEKKSYGKRPGKENSYLTQWEARESLDSYAKDQGYLLYRSSKITTYPDESRTCGVADVFTRNMCYIAHSQLDKITDHRFDFYCTDIEDWPARIAMKENTFYILTDLKKSGWSTPLEIVKTVYDVASDLYVNSPFKRYAELKEHMILDEHKVYGGIIGFDDNAISFFLSNAFEEFLEREQLEEDVTACFKGDDSIIEIVNVSKTFAEKVMIKWAQFLRDLGILISTSKCRVTRIGQFCEKVGLAREDTSKILEHALNFVDCCWNKTIYGCKEYTRNLYRSLELFYPLEKHRTLLHTAFMLVSTSYSSEFGHPYEPILPFEIGGWISFYEDGMNTLIRDYVKGSFDWIDDYRYFNLIDCQKSFKSFKVFKDRKNKLKNMAKIPIAFDGFEELIEKYFKQQDSNPVRREKFFSGERSNKFFFGPNKKKAYFPSKLYLSMKDFLIPDEYLIPKYSEFSYKLIKSKIRLNWNQLKNKPNVKNAYRKPPAFQKRKRIESQTIDEVRAHLLFAELAGYPNEFKINYLKPVPIIVLLWSMFPIVFRSGRCIPIDWYKFSKYSGITFNKLFQRFNKRSLTGASSCDLFNLVPFGLKLAECPELLVFKGPPDSDAICFDERTGLPIRFDTVDYIGQLSGKAVKSFSEFSYNIVKEFYDMDAIEIGGAKFYGAMSHYRPAPVVEEYRTSGGYTVDECIDYARDMAFEYNVYDPELLTLYLAINFISSYEEFYRVDGLIKEIKEKRVDALFDIPPEPLDPDSSGSRDVHSLSSDDEMDEEALLRKYVGFAENEDDPDDPYY